MKNIKFIAIFTGLLLGNVAMAQVTVTSVAVRPDFNLDLKLGSKGEEVTLLQNFLSKMPNVYPEALVTGYYGKLTENAVKKFQKENNIEQVGVVGPKTRELLLKLSKDRIYNLGNANVDGMNDPKVAPQVFELKSFVTGTSTAYVFWTTNKYTTSDLYYAKTSPLASTTPVVVTDNNLSFTHSVNINGLDANTTYYYMVRVTDNRGNRATTTENTLKTLSQ